MARTGRPRTSFQKWPRELLEKTAAESRNYSDLMRRLGCHSYSGTLHRHLKVRLQELGISTDHFLGVRSNIGRISWRKKTADQVLVVSTGVHKAKLNQLHRALEERGVEKKCASCGLGVMWQGRPLVLQIDHVNGDWRDNRIENLRFLCPNCHSQTPTFGNKPRYASGEAGRFSAD